MSLNVSNSAEQKILERILADDLVLRLFVNNRVPTEGDIWDSYTEADQDTAHGYSAKTLSGGSWDISTVQGVTSAVYAEQTFTITQDVDHPHTTTIYGYCVTDDEDPANLFWAERFSDCPYVLPKEGGTIKITPTISLD